MSLKILQITPSFTPSTAYGGPTKSVDALCEKLVQAKHLVTVLTTTANGEKELSIKTNKEYNIKGTRVIYFPRITKDHSHLSPSLLVKVFKTARNFDIIHIHSWWNLVAILATLIVLIQRKKPIISIRGMLSKYTLESSRKRIFHRFIGKYLLKKCILHVTSEKEKQECIDALGNFNSFTLPNFITLPPVFDIQHENKLTTFKFSTLSRIHPVKNIETTLLCLSKLDFKWEINIIGEGEPKYEEQLKVLSRALNIDDKIIWHGHLENAAKYQVLAKTDLYIQLSLTENFGNSIIEAASIGLPVLVTETIGAAEYVRKFNLGWVVPLKNDEILFTIKNVKKHICEGAYESNVIKVRSEFSGKSLAQKYIKAYN